MGNGGFLRNVEDFKDLTDEQLAMIGKCCTEREYRQGDTIFIEGEPAGDMWVVVEGEVELRFDLPHDLNLNNDSYVLMTGQHNAAASSADHGTSRYNTISSISGGKTFGWTSFVPPYTHCLSAYCASERCKVIQMDHDGLIAIFETDARIGYLVMASITRLVGKRFHQLQDEVVKRKGYEIMFQWS